MTIEQIQAERQKLEEQIDLAVSQFKDRCDLKDWQVTVARGQVKISVNGGPSSDAYEATVSVRV